jgi:integrase
VRGAYAPSTVADVAGSVRCFARFLLATGRISIELAESVVVPKRHKFERPRRALSWQDVQRLLRSVDASSRGGLRDYALLLMMSTYGLGAGEVIRLQLRISTGTPPRSMSCGRRPASLSRCR